MPYHLQPFHSIPFDRALLDHLLDRHEHITLPRLQRLWRYFRNDLAEPDSEGRSRAAPGQSVGLPDRLRPGARRRDRDDRFNPEQVVENDIAWRVHTLVDFMFPKPPRLVSTAHDPLMRGSIEAVLSAIFHANGGIALWQDMALLGSVYGSVNLLLNVDSLLERPRNRRSENSMARNKANDFADLAAGIGIDLVEAPRALALLNREDYRELDLFILHHERADHRVEREGAMRRMLSPRWLFGGSRLSGDRRARTTVTRLYSKEHIQWYEDDVLVRDLRNPLGRVPIVHVQNLSQPYRFDGVSDVEPLIPLQDELNTRLSDRAYRVTMQSFRMYLGKGIDSFTDRPIGPGQMWMTDNTDASIETFGGDAASPSEEAHIEELREALDKASGVTPAAAGHIKAKIGNLTSENALRVSLMGTIAKIKRKRVTYGRGIEELCGLILHALHTTGAFLTRPEDRGIEIAWPDPLPTDESRRIQDALAKAKLGVPEGILRAELGYPDEPTRDTTSAPQAVGVQHRD